jgi:hypothetical protein
LKPAPDVVSTPQSPKQAYENNPEETDGYLSCTWLGNVIGSYGFATNSGIDSEFLSL